MTKSQVKPLLKINMQSNSKSIDSSQASKNPLLKIKDFEVIKKEYALSEQELVPIIVLQKMSETLELYLKIIQQILQPEEFHSMYECLSFTESDKTSLMELYKQIVILHRDILKAEITNDETEILSLITIIHTKIALFKPKMRKIVEKMQDSWINKDVKTKSAQYFG